MPTTTTTYSFNKPVVGADEDDWGGYLNGNWDSVDDLLDGTTPVTGIDINSGTLDGVTIGGTTAGAGTFTTLTATGTTTLAGASTSADITFGDNDKAIFGADSDLTIFSDGTHSRIEDSATNSGDLYIRGSNNLRLQTWDGVSAWQDAIVMDDAGAAELYHNGALKLTTTSTGIDVTGTVTADGLTVDTDAYRRLLLTYPDAFTSKLQVGFSNFYVQGSATNDRLTIANNSSGQTHFENQSKTSMVIDNSGDISFYEDTGTTAKFFWDASAESLGIGTSSPSAPLTVQTSATTNVDIKTSATNGTAQLRFSNDARTYSLGIDNNDSFFVYDATGTSTRMTIDSSGNVGIGTSSPRNVLHAHNSDNGGIRFSNTATGSGASDGFYVGNVFGSTDALLQNYEAGAIRFSTSATERMRIDSSGNLLVGKTSIGTSTDGFEARAGGITGVSDTSGAALYVNRNGSDGDMVIFQKVGTTVGSIGTAAGDLSIGSDDAFLFFDGGANKIVPASTSSGGASNGLLDLGASDRRFKDLYLSGGVYLGGTGAANKLEDYEEGTWTPTFTSWTTNPTSASGRYTKIGRLVLITFKASGGAKASATSAYIEGLPFAIEGSGAVGSVSNSAVADYGNVLFQNTDRMWFTNNSFSSTWYASGVYETTA